MAKRSGLSLRTIQRVENGETKPTGETLKRVSNILGVTPDELIEGSNEKPKQTVKTKYDYLHIFDDKLVISKTPEIDDLVEDYGKSVNNVFKSLMVIFIGVLVFTTLAVVFYNSGKTLLAIQGVAFSLFFFANAFQLMLFTSGSSLIHREDISKIAILKKLFRFSIVQIIHSESGRQKNRTLILEKSQVENMKSSLLSEKLIEEKDIKLKIKDTRVSIVIYTLLIVAPIAILFADASHEIMSYYNALLPLVVSIGLIIRILFKLITPHFSR